MNPSLSVLGLALRWPSPQPRAGAALALGGARFARAKIYTYGVTLTRNFDPDVDFFPNIF